MILVRRGNREYGPYSRAAAEQYLANGQLRAGDMARLVGESAGAARPLSTIVSNRASRSAAPLAQPQRRGFWRSVARLAIRVLVWLWKRFRALAPRTQRRVALVAVLLVAGLVAYSVLHRTRIETAPDLDAYEAVFRQGTPADLELVRAADRHALSLGAQRGTTVPKLAALLAKGHAGSSATDQLWQARAIFRWIAEHVVYDVDALRSGRRPEFDPDSVLTMRRAVCEGYAGLFSALCRELNLRVATIAGYSHTERADIGRASPGDQALHAWNAVRIGGRWMLMDATWGAGYVNEKAFVQQFNPAWFDMAPELFILSHFPTDDAWQQLPRPWSLQQFTELPILKTEFLKVAENPAAVRQGTLSPGQQRLELRLRAETEVLARTTAGGGDLEVKGPGAASGRYATFQVQLPDGSGPESFIELFTREPTDPARTYRLAAVFRFGAGAAGENSSRAAMPAARPALREQSSGPAPSSSGSEPNFFAAYDERGAKLEQPTARVLPAGQWQRFRVRVPGARNVRARLPGDTVQFFHRAGGDVFEANLWLERGNVRIYAAFDGVGAPLHGLIGFEAR